MITVAWHDKAQTILYIRFAGEWAWDEYERVIADSMGMIASVPHRVDAIVHIVDDGAIKLSPGAIQRWRDDLLKAPENMHSLVHVSRSSFFYTLIQAFTSLLPVALMSRVHMVNSLDQAQARIAFLRGE